MKFINPVGRTAGGGDTIKACMCSTGYAGYRGNNDSCIHCGCGCSSGGAYRTGNRVKAISTIRSSTT